MGIEAENQKEGQRSFGSKSQWFANRMLNKREIMEHNVISYLIKNREYIALAVVPSLAFLVSAAVVNGGYEFMYQLLAR